MNLQTKTICRDHFSGIRNDLLFVVMASNESKRFADFSLIEYHSVILNQLFTQSKFFHLTYLSGFLDTTKQLQDHTQE